MRTSDTQKAENEADSHDNVSAVKRERSLQFCRMKLHYEYFSKVLLYELLLRVVF